MLWAAIFSAPAALCAQATQPAKTSTAAAAPTTRQPGDELHFWVMTMEPGDLIWEQFGHNALWIHDESTGYSAVYNWGMFDFEEPGFFRNFLLGRLRYWMEPFDPEATANAYASQNRSVWVQELNLSAEQKLKLRDHLAWNEREENRYYWYNYYTDNCSTRVRDAVDLAVGGQLAAALKAKPTDTTYHWHTRRLTQVSPFWYTLLNTAHGQPSSQVKLSAWDESFLPTRFRDYLREVKVTDALGNLVPLVRNERVVFKSTRPPEAAAPPNWIAWYFLGGAVVAGVLAWLAGRAGGSRAARGGFVTLATLYSLVLAIAALIGLWFWVFSAHWAAWRNENLFAYSPLAVPLVVALPMMARRGGRWGTVAVALAAAIAASTLLGVAVQVLPQFDQANGEPLALVLPINLALAWGVWRYAKARPVPAVEKPNGAPSRPDRRGSGSV